MQKASPRQGTFLICGERQKPSPLPRAKVKVKIGVRSKMLSCGTPQAAGSPHDETVQAPPRRFRKSPMASSKQFSPRVVDLAPLLWGFATRQVITHPPGEKRQTVLTPVRKGDQPPLSNPALSAKNRKEEARKWSCGR